MVEIDDTDIECISAFDQFTPLKPSKSPVLLLGMTVRNSLDHDRLLIHSKYNPKRYKQLTQHFDGTNEWVCMYGVEVQPTREIKHLYHTLITLPDCDSDVYSDVVKLHGLTCEENFLLMRKNLILIDIKHLTIVTKTNQFSTFNKLREMLITNDKYPWYINWCDFKIFFIL
jgi:hypothetical protein